MGYGLKRLLEIEAEKKAKKEEKARLKKEKEEEKKRLKKIEHKKKLRKKQNRRAYLKKRNTELSRRNEMGDEYAYYSVYITKNRKRIRFLGGRWWKTDAYKIFTNAIEGNRKKVKFPQTEITEKLSGKKAKTVPVKYEILLVKKTKDEDETTASFKNEMGKYVDNIVTDWENHIIVDKADWFVETKFGIYGHHPQKDKKTYDFILNDMLLGNEDVGDEMRRIMVYKNKLIIQYLDDFDFVTCYNENQCAELYDKLQTDITKLKKKYIVFMGKIVPELISTWIDRFEGKTGWNRYKLSHKSTKN